MTNDNIINTAENESSGAMDNDLNTNSPTTDELTPPSAVSSSDDATTPAPAAAPVNASPRSTMYTPDATPADIPEYEQPQPIRRSTDIKTARLQYSAYSDMCPAPKSYYAPISPAAYTWMMVLFSIPVIGFFIAIIYASTANKLAKRNFAFGYMILVMILVTICAIAAILLAYVFRDAGAEFWKWFSNLIKALS